MRHLINPPNPISAFYRKTLNLLKLLRDHEVSLVFLDARVTHDEGYTRFDFIALLVETGRNSELGAVIAIDDGHSAEGARIITPSDTANQDDYLEALKTGVEYMNMLIHMNVAHLETCTHITPRWLDAMITDFRKELNVE